MYHLRRNKSELIVLTGAIYSFVAYLTAFTLEILFLVDLTRRSSEILSTFSTASSVTTLPSNTADNIDGNIDGHQTLPTTTLLDRLNFESMQAHITISCLTISILYFVIFITSLTLIVALILRSTFMLLIWMCAMTTMYLPEFGLVMYVSVYSWGLETRNGQTELMFYLFRAALNFIFIYRARKLFKQWNYEKNFFRLKSGSQGAFSTGSHHQFGHSSSSPYDSPYFIGRGSSTSCGGVGGGGDSLTTTINPIFSSSTLNLNCYDFVRDQYNQQANSSANGASSCGPSPTTNSSTYGVSSADATSDSNNNNNNNSNNIQGLIRSRLAAAALYSREQQATGKGTGPVAKLSSRSSYNEDSLNECNSNISGNYLSQVRNNGARQFYLADAEAAQKRATSHGQNQSQQYRQLSLLSINDDFQECELDLDYRTLGKSSARKQHNSNVNNREHVAASSRGQYRAQQHQHQQPTTTGQRFNPHLDDHCNSQHHEQTLSSARVPSSSSTTTISRSHDDLAYSTRSLDRRNIKDFTLTEQVVLRPLGHQPFDYLQRPGSTSNLNYS